MPITTPAPDVDLLLRVAELEEQLERERARNAGLEQGIEALTVRCEALRAELARLRGVPTPD